MSTYAERIVRLEDRIVARARAAGETWRWATWATEPRGIGDILIVKDAAGRARQVAAIDYVLEA